MLFNSLIFVAFFLVVYGLYLSLRRSRQAQNYLLLAASYLFYGYWDWRFLGLVAFTTLVDYAAGRRMGASEDERIRHRWLLVSLVSNLTVLGFFKYFNFFATTFAGMLSAFGLHPDALTLKIILPIGISFYTFQSLSYTIDVYKRRMEPVTFLPDYALFVSMFPQLLSGPIARAREMLPQIQSNRVQSADRIHSALFLILWGYFKKVVIADNLAKVADTVFDGYRGYHGLDLIVGLLAFAIQIYGDFSGYSDIARGIARLLGFELPLNFRLPYFALSPSDFWSRWNISLSTWLRDYVYWPLMSSRQIPAGKHTLEVHAFRNMMLTMLLGGLWHGASWNFVLWGGYYGALLILYRIVDTWHPTGNPWKAPHAALQILPRMALMFVLTLAGWLLFRSHSLEQIAYFLTHMGIGRSAETVRLGAKLLAFAAPLFLMQIWQYRTGNLLAPTELPTWARTLLYTTLLIIIFMFGVRESSEFIYRQF